MDVSCRFRLNIKLHECIINGCGLNTHIIICYPHRRMFGLAYQDANVIFHSMAHDE